jgi:hypothetical protein
MFCSVTCYESGCLAAWHLLSPAISLKTNVVMSNNFRRFKNIQNMEYFVNPPPSTKIE